MDDTGCVNVFLSEGAGVSTIVEEMLARGEEPKRDAFGHVKLDTINPGSWFAKQFAGMVGAEKTMVQKSGYFARSAAANDEDLALIRACADLAVDAALRGESGVIGQDEERRRRAARRASSPGSRAARRSTRPSRGSASCSSEIGQPLGTLVPSTH